MNGSVIRDCKKFNTHRIWVQRYENLLYLTRKITYLS